MWDAPGARRVLPGQSGESCAWAHRSRVGSSRARAKELSSTRQRDHTASGALLVARPAPSPHCAGARDLQSVPPARTPHAVPRTVGRRRSPWTSEEGPMTDETDAADPPAAPPCPSICAAPSTMPPSGSAAVRGPAQRGRHEGGSGSPDPSPASAGPRARRRPPPPRRATIPLPRESRTQYLESMTGAGNARWGELPGENSPCPPPAIPRIQPAPTCGPAARGSLPARPGRGVRTALEAVPRLHGPTLGPRHRPGEDSESQ